MDPVVFRDDNVPVELFVDYDQWIKAFARDVRALREQNELRGERDQVGIHATTHFSRPGAPHAVISVNVVDFDPV